MDHNFVGHCSNVLVNHVQKSLCLGILDMELLWGLVPLFFHSYMGQIFISFLYSKVNLKVNKITLEISFDLSFPVP